jgi:hypothetical protein
MRSSHSTLFGLESTQDSLRKIEINDASVIADRKKDFLNTTVQKLESLGEG